MMLLVAKQDVIEQWAIGGQEWAGHLDRLGVPVFRLIRFYFHVELFEAADFLF